MFLKTHHEGPLKRGWVGQNFYQPIAANCGSLSKNGTPYCTAFVVLTHLRSFFLKNAPISKSIIVYSFLHFKVCKFI